MPHVDGSIANPRYNVRVSLVAGVAIPFWLFFGVLLTALGYDGYSHLDQAMSQLGARGAPTGAISPWINNVPLAALFAVFAWGVSRRYRTSGLAQISAGLILLHGLGSLAAGYFPCEAGCAPVQPSTSQQLHNLAGLVMFVSLTLACALWIVLGRRLLGSRGFGVFSLVCTITVLGTVLLMAHAMETGQLFGLYQRLNYGISVLWVGVLAWMSGRCRSTRAAQE